MTPEIKNLIEERKRKDSMLGHLKHKVIATKDSLSIIQRKTFYGIMDETGKYLFRSIGHFAGYDLSQSPMNKGFFMDSKF